MSNAFDFPFNNSYAQFPERFFTPQNPTPVSDPELIAFNKPLAAQLGLNTSAIESPEGIAILAGNAIPTGANPIATVYAGHQFGGWNPQLGDGRAVLLGEVLDRNGNRQDIQLKGAGRTPYSRGGDGRSPIGPVVREYVVSEAMAALGIPTTRALAAIKTSDTIVREHSGPGGVLTRVAPSHIRVGTFQYFAARRDDDAVALLIKHVIDRHYPHLAKSTEPALALLEIVLQKQAELVARWQAIGFIHGVMNTDNSSVAGITIDYGPCAFMDAFKSDKVFSSIDHQGRYAYKNQPGIAQWNMANFAQCLLPHISGTEDEALEHAQAIINAFPSVYVNAYLAQFRQKLGLVAEHEEDAELIEDLLDNMEQQQADFTNTFRALSHCALTEPSSDDDSKDTDFLACFTTATPSADWMKRWRTRQGKEQTDATKRRELMRSSNPAYIPRNHRIEQTIQAAEQGDYSHIEKMLSVLRDPYNEQAGQDEFALAPKQDEEVKATFCGT